MEKSCWNGINITEPVQQKTPPILTVIVTLAGQSHRSSTKDLTTQNSALFTFDVEEVSVCMEIECMGFT